MARKDFTYAKGIPKRKNKRQNIKIKKKGEGKKSANSS